MSSAFSSSAAVARFSAQVLLVGVAVVIAAQVWTAIPMAAAIALIAWGTVLTVNGRPGLSVLAAVVYAPLGVLAVMAQVDVAMRAASLAWGLFAGLDSALAIMLLYNLSRHTGELLARRIA